MKESELQAAIVEAAHVFSWRVAHFRPARTKHGWATPVSADGAGWPDLVLVRDRLICAEVKGDGGRLRPEQRAWLDAFYAAGVEAYVWTPKEWQSGDVESILR